MPLPHDIEVLITVPFPESVLQELRAISPRIKITFISARKTEEIPEEIWHKVEVLYTDILLPELELVPNLKWIQFHYAGIDFIQNTKFHQKKGLQITTMSGASVIQVGEYVLMMLLGLGHHLPDLLDNQEKHEWPADRWERFSPRELHNATVGLVGYGSIAREVARLVKAFKARVLAAKKNVLLPVETDFSLEDHGDPSGNYFDRMYPIEALRSMVKECDFVVVTLPLTPETRGLINDDVFRAMKPSACLIHISRGGIVDENALISALSEKRIAAAALDVFSQEPLPPDNPLWKTPNLLLTPHISGFSPRYKERAGRMFAENLRLYLHGERLLNLYNHERHY